jgi:hypothetical protein
VAIHGRGFDTPKVTENIVRSYPEAIAGAFNIGLLHTSLEGNAAHATYAPCSVDDLVARGYDYWALGHIHQHEIVRDVAPTIVYAGSPQGRHVNEAGEHGVYVLSVADGELVGAPEHVEIASIRWHHVTIDASDAAGADVDMDAVVARVRAAVEEIATEAPDVRHIARVTITGRCAAHVQIAQDPDAFTEQLHLTVGAVSAADVHLERVRVRTRPPLPDPATLYERQDMIGSFALHVDSVLLEAGTDGATASAALPPVLAKANERLLKLGADGAALMTSDLASIDAADVRDDLLALLIAQSEAAGQTGDAR